MASGSSAQNRERDRRTYQFVNASANWQLLTGAGDIAFVHRDGQVVAQFGQLRQDVAIQHVRRIARQVPTLGAYSARKL